MAVVGSDEVHVVDEVDGIAVVPEYLHHVGLIHIGSLVLGTVVHQVVHVQEVRHNGNRPDGFCVFGGAGDVEGMILKEREEFVVVKVVVAFQILAAAVFVH